MTQEEKAKAYDDALKYATIYYNNGDADMKLMMSTCFPKLKESEDERIRKAIHIYLDWLNGRNKDYQPKGDYSIKDMIAWLEKQGEYANFRNKIQVGDKVTRNRDGVLVNLSQLKRVANPSEKQGEQNPAWSEEDKDVINHLLAICNGAKKFIQFESCSREDIIKCQDWLTSLKERI